MRNKTLHCDFEKVTKWFHENYMVNVTLCGRNTENKAMFKINYINDTHKEKLVLYCIEYKNLMKYKVGCF